VDAANIRSISGRSSLASRDANAVFVVDFLKALSPMRAWGRGSGEGEARDTDKRWSRVKRVTATTSANDKPSHKFAAPPPHPNPLPQR